MLEQSNKYKLIHNVTGFDNNIRKHWALAINPYE